LILGGIKIPLFNGINFSLGTTGGVLIMCLVFGHFGRIGKLSMEIPETSVKTLKELGLMLFLIGAGVDGGVSLVSAVKDDASIVAWGFIGGVVITIIPMLVGFFLGKYVLKLPLLANLGSITGGMTSTPALGTLISTAETDDVAGAYASTYPIALVLIVIACNLLINLMM
jgi:putative transport protein